MIGGLYRETALLASAVMILVCIMGGLQILQNVGFMRFGASTLRRLFRANKVLWLVTVPTTFMAVSYLVWRILLVVAPTDVKVISIFTEALVLVSFFAVALLLQNLHSEAEKFKQAGLKLEQFIEEMKNGSSMSDEDRDMRILGARLTALEVNELMGQKPSNDTWLDSSGT